MTDKEIDEIISQMCTNRKNNPDVMLMDSIQKMSTHDEILIEDSISKSIEEEIIKKLTDSIEDVSTVDNITDVEISSIENEIKAQIEKEKEAENELSRFQKNDDKNSYEILDSVILDTNTSNISDCINETINVELQEDNNMNEDIKTTPNDISESDVTTHSTTELADDFPVTNFDIDEKLITDKINKSYTNINESEVYELISVMNRFKNKEKFNVYEALPNIFKSEIFKASMEIGGETDKNTLNFLAKSFINEIIEDSIMNDEIDKFSTELKNISESVNNMPGLIVDGYNDEVKSKFEGALNEAYENTKDSNPDKAERIKLIKNFFVDSYTLERIFTIIDETPSLINRAYKTARDKFKTVITESKSKFGVNSKFGNISSNNRIPSIKTIDLVYDVLKEKYEYASTISVLIHNSMISALECSNDIDAYIYCYYIVSGIMSMRFTANNSEYTNKLKDNLKRLDDTISNYMSNIQTNNKKKRKKG